MGNPKLVPGIRTRYRFRGKSREMLISDEEKLLEVKFFVDLGNPKVDSDFVTSPALRNKIQKLKLTKGTPIGEMGLVCNPINQTVLWTTYDPFKEVPDLARIGISSELELRALGIAKGRFSRLEHILHNDPKEHRKTQLLKRGLKEDEISRGIEYAKAIDLLKRRIARNKVKAFRRRKVKSPRPNLFKVPRARRKASPRRL